MSSSTQTSCLVANGVFLRGKRTVLTAVSEDHAPLLAKWINDPEVRAFLTNGHPQTAASEREWVQSLMKKRDTDIVLLIHVKSVPIGVMGIHYINWRDRIATTGAFIGEKAYWGKGYGTDAKMALLDHAFNTLNLRKICSDVIEFNKRSLAYSLHCGYQIEGRRRQHVFRNGRYWDLIQLGLFKEEWLPHWKKHQRNRRRS